MLTYILYNLMRGFNLFILWYVVVMSSISVLQMIIALFITPAHMKKARHLEHKLMGKSSNIIPISVLAPAYNEEVTIVESIRSMLNMSYSNFEIVVINDGSKDSTLETVIKAFGLHKSSFPVREQIPTRQVRGIYYNPDLPRLRLIDKENGGKSDALNAGINAARYPYVVSLDADSLLESDALLRIAVAFMQDKYTVAVGGIIRVANGCKISKGKVTETALPKNTWALFQSIEYFRSFLVGRIGWGSLNALLIISGAFGAFQKEAVIAVGGYTTGTVGEDMDLIIKLHRYMRFKKYKYKVSFLPDPICWTQVPEDLAVLYRQRRRWQIGLIDVLSRYKDMFLNPKYGVLGFLAMPYYFLFEMVSPVVELLGYIMIPVAWYFDFLTFNGMVLFFVAAILFGVISSVGSLVVEEFTESRFIRIRDFAKLVLFSIVENVFYRQMTVFFRFVGLLSFNKLKHSWGVMKRREFSTTEK